MKIKIQGDVTNHPFFSSNIIINNLNKALEELDSFGNDVVVQYDALAQARTDDVKAFISTWEITFHPLILNNAKLRPILGVSKDNAEFIRSSKYDKKLIGWFPLGVDCNLWRPIQRNENTKKIITFAIFSESLCRGGFELAIDAYCKLFSNNSNTCLKLKDRNGTKTFKQFVDYKANSYKANIEYINEHWDNINKIEDFFSDIDCLLALNRSSTWNLPTIQAMSMQIPVIAVNYSGHREYCEPNVNCLCPDFKLTPMFDDLDYLEKIGTRNFFFKDRNNYAIDPTWATVDIDSLMECMVKMYENKDNLRQRLAENGRKTAEKFTWIDSAQKLSRELTKWF